ncbi:MAG TPA: ThiF family adenylyltransferase [Clostridia bacterium]|nr:ThiF family adenylyltransferase [Clostridia bacterium]
MILTKDQINRYMRHIAMPEISGQGQKKILGSSVVFYCEDYNKESLALYYLAASGVGQIYCRFNDASGWEKLSDNLSDLNSDVKIQLLTEEALQYSEGQSVTGIIAGNPGFVKKTLEGIIKSGYDKNPMPLIVSMHNGWNGLVQTLTSQVNLEEFISVMADYEDCNSCFGNLGCSDNLSAYFSGLMAVIEHLKLTLSLGKPLSNALYYDLSAVEFDFTSSSADLLHKLLSTRVIETDLTPLADARVLIIGCGGLGSTAAFALAALGIGSLGLVDFDTVEISNLNRQIMHSTSRIGMPKVQSAEIFLKQINPDVKLETYNTRIRKGNVNDIISSYDIIIGGLDNLPARYILNDACYAAKKPLIEAGALDISGLATTIIPDEGHCYRCIFPETEDNNSVPSCSETGVLGPVPGIMGIVEAAEAIKLLTGTGKSLKNRILLFDVFETDIYVASHEKNKYCELCGNI